LHAMPVAVMTRAICTGCATAVIGRP
jgi:hypothetical protein